MMLCCKDMLRRWSEKYDKSAFQYCFLCNIYLCKHKDVMILFEVHHESLTIQFILIRVVLVIVMFLNAGI